MLAALAVIMPCAWLGPLDETAVKTIDAGLKRALVSFAAARALNAVISVAQGTEVAVQPGGLGLNLTPGQLLDPINDLVEQFASLMLTASVAFGIQKILISIGGYWVVAPILTAIALGWSFFAWRDSPPLWLSRALLLVLIVRFAVPLVTVGSDALYAKFMSADYTASSQAIEVAKDQFVAETPPATEASSDKGFIERIRDWWSQKVDAGKRIEKVKRMAEQMTENIVKLLVIFVMQTIVLPL